MFVQRLVTGPYQTNCYLLGSQETESCWIIDPGNDADRIIAEIQRLQVQPVAMLFTHTHWDHIAAAGPLKAHYPQLEVLVSEEDAPNLSYETIQATCIDRWFVEVYDEALQLLPHPTGYLKDGQFLEDSKLQVIATPGHTPGGLCFYHEEGQLLFTGDTLFAGSVGRTDLGGGDTQTLIDSCKKLLELPDAVQVLPGHGPASTIAAERSNPFLQ